MAGVLDLFRLDGRVAVGTGGAKGIGMYYSEALLQAGASVVVADIDAASVRDTTSRLSEEFPGRALGAELDVNHRESIDAMVRDAMERWGRLDILVNNAALFSAIPPRESAWGISDDEWDRVLSTNIRGIYACTEACAPSMADTGEGRVINISSGLAFKGSTALIHYAASKAAVVNLTRSLAVALGPRKITVNSLAPGATNSDTVLEARAARAAAGGPPPGPVGRRGDQNRILDRVELPADLLGTLIYLASPASEFVTGQTIVVDGGSYLH